MTRLRIPLLLVGAACCIAGRQNSYANELTQPTAQAFAHYVQLTEARIQNEVSDPRQFLYSYTLPEKATNAVRCITGFTGMRSFLGLSRSVPPGFDQELQKHLRAFVDN